ncbi:MAG: hypothetical protein ACAI25_02640, partial [Planctomycetota bacterium]
NANVFRAAANDRVDAITQLRGTDSGSARDAGVTAAFEGDVGRALIAFRIAQRSLRDGRAKLAELQEAVSGAEKQNRWAEKLEAKEDDKGKKATAFQRALLVETAYLLRDFLPLDDPRRDAAVRFLDERERKKNP